MGPKYDKDRKLRLKKAWLDMDATKANNLAGKVPIGVGVTVALSMHMKNGDRRTYGLTKDRTGKIVGGKSNELEPAHTPETTHFAYPTWCMSSSSRRTASRLNGSIQTCRGRITGCCGYH